MLIDTTYNIVFSLLAATGFSPAAYGNVISVAVKNGSWGALINWDCVGWKSVLALFALIFATELPLRTKIKGFLLLAPVIYLVNIGRIWFIFWYVVTFDIANFALVHAVVWSWGLITAVIIFWLAWLRISMKRSNLPNLKYPL
ncbi:MAG: exosortase/archaeosortase family protein [Candidatus Aenigmarchaeota archaeon]|nr:exosortase/archaeosortase family protein [Candidatus Aenigmarchaeota archaeon]